MAGTSPAPQGQRLHMEVDASRKLAAAQFGGDGEKLTHDMVIFSLLAYLGVEQFDWQIKRVQFVSKSMGTLTYTAPGSDECTKVTKDQLQTMLVGAGNAFAEGNMFFGPQALCLPPHSTIRVKPDAVILTNPFCEISFVLEPSHAVSTVKPGTHGMEQPTLPSGEASLETRATGIRTTIRYFALRAQHRDMPKYRDWSKRVVSGAQNWFMGKQSD